MQKAKLQKFSFKNVLLITFLLILISFFTFLIFSLDFEIIENSKIIAKENLILFLLTKNIVAKNLFEQEADLIKINYKFDFRNFKIYVEKIKEEPVALICYKDDCYFLGKHSYIYKKRNSSYKNLLPIKSYYPIYENSYLKPELTNALVFLFEYSNLKLLILKEIKILSNFDLLVKTKDFSFLLDPHKNVKNQLNKLSFFIENYKDTNYSLIDLRINHKIFFK